MKDIDDTTSSAIKKPVAFKKKGVKPNSLASRGSKSADSLVSNISKMMTKKPVK